MIFIGPGEYNLNGLKEIKAKDSFLGLREEIRGCGIEDSILSCRTNLYIDSLLKKCKCLPITLRLSDKVSRYRLFIMISFIRIIYVHFKSTQLLQLHNFIISSF